MELRAAMFVHDPAAGCVLRLRWQYPCKIATVVAPAGKPKRRLCPVALDSKVDGRSTAKRVLKLDRAAPDQCHQIGIYVEAPPDVLVVLGTRMTGLEQSRTGIFKA